MSDIVERLRGLLREAIEDCYVRIPYGASHEDVSAIRDFERRIKEALGQSDTGKWAAIQEQQKQHGEAQELVAKELMGGCIESAVETADFSTTESGNWHNWLREEIVKALRERDNEIKRLRQRMQIMREWMQDAELMGAGAWAAWYGFVYDHPEASDWFSEDGVPR